MQRSAPKPFGQVCAAVALVGVMAVVASSACRPSLDGAWEGDARCTNATYPISALFDEQEDLDLHGTIYIENILLVGVLRADIEGGEYDAEDNEYRFDLETDGDDGVEFRGRLAIDEKDTDRAEGEFDAFNDNGESTDTCDVDLERLSVTGN